MADNSVNEPGLAYEEMAATGQWSLLADLWPGTPSMQAARSRRTPNFEKESDKDYQARIDLNILYPMWRRTVSRLVSKPYSKPVTWKDGLPERLEAFVEDVDGAGTSLTQFSRAWFQEGVRWGIGHALVDFTPIEVNLGGERTATRGEEEAAGVRPVAVRISPPNLIDWRFERRGGEDVLVEIRYRGSRTKRDGFEQKTVKTVTHYTDTDVEVWETSDATSDKFDMVSSRTHTFGRVPLRTWYANRTGIMAADPPLLELAETNGHHWQVSADYNVLLYIVSQARLCMAGVSDKEKAQIKEHSSKKTIILGNPGSKVWWAEHSGAALTALERALQKIEDRGEALSAQPTSRSKSPVTATGEIRGEQDAVCDLQAWAGSQEDGLLGVLELAAEWVGEKVPEDFGFKIHRGFTIGPESNIEIQALQKDEKEGRITGTTYLKEAQRRGLYSDDVDPEDESEDASQAAVERGLLFTGGDQGGPPADGDEAAA